MVCYRKETTSTTTTAVLAVAASTAATNDENVSETGTIYNKIIATIEG